VYFSTPESVFPLWWKPAFCSIQNYSFVVCLYFYTGDGKTNNFFFIFMYLVNYIQVIWTYIYPLNAELNPICHLLALLGAHHILHISRIRVKRQSATMDGYLDSHERHSFRGMEATIRPCPQPLHSLSHPQSPGSYIIFSVHLHPHFWSGPSAFEVL
jgi:hypothetical protein